MPKSDPLALLRRWGVVVRLAGVDFRIPPRSAADWIEAILEGSVIPDLLEEESAAVVGQLVSRELVAADELRDRSREAIMDAAGRAWWEVIRLVGLLSQEPDAFGGELVRRGFDFEARSIGAYCAAAYALAVSGLEKRDRVRFDYLLTTPPVSEVADNEEAMSAAFMVAMQQRP